MEDIEQQIANAIQQVRDEIGANEQQRVAFAYAEAAMRSAVGKLLRPIIEENEALKHDLERQMTIANTECNEAVNARAEALERAAKIAESHATCGCNGKHGTCLIDDAPKAIAEEIRAIVVKPPADKSPSWKLVHAVRSGALNALRHCNVDEELFATVAAATYAPIRAALSPTAEGEKG